MQLTKTRLSSLVGAASAVLLLAGPLAASAWDGNSYDNNSYGDNSSYSNSYDNNHKEDYGNRDNNYDKQDWNKSVSWDNSKGTFHCSDMNWDNRSSWSSDQWTKWNDNDCSNHKSDQWSNSSNDWNRDWNDSSRYSYSSSSNDWNHNYGSSYDNCDD